MYYKIYIHPTCARRAPRQPPTDIYLLIVGSIYPIQNVKMYIPPPQYHSIHVAHCSWEQQSLYLCICVFVFLYLSGCQLSLGTFSFFCLCSRKYGPKWNTNTYIYSIDIHPPIVKNISQISYKIYIHPPWQPDNLQLTYIH